MGSSNDRLDYCPSCDSNWAFCVCAETRVQAQAQGQYPFDGQLMSREDYLKDAKQAFDAGVMQKVEEFIKADAGKAEYGLIPPATLDEVAHVFTYGAAKYSPDNWHKCDDNMRYFNAAMRHIMAWRRGEYFDEESGFNHLAHAIASLMMLRGLEIDVD